MANFPDEEVRSLLRRWLSCCAPLRLDLIAGRGRWRRMCKWDLASIGAGRFWGEK